VGVRDATKCARWRLTSAGSASTKRFLFLIMLMGRDCAKSVSESSTDLHRFWSWIMTLWSVAGSMTPLLALASST